MGLGPGRALRCYEAQAGSTLLCSWKGDRPGCWPESLGQELGPALQSAQR